MVCATSKASDQPAHTRSLIRAFASRFEYSITVKLLTEQHLELLSLTGGCRGSSESKLVKMPNCLKSHVAAHLLTLSRLESHKQVILHTLQTPHKMQQSECQTVWIQISPNKVMGLIWIHTVCKSYQQMTLVGIELTLMQSERSNLLCQSECNGVRCTQKHILAVNDLLYF